MKIRIYQINSDRDVNHMMFMAYERLEKLQGSSAVNCKIYDKIYDADVDCKSLEEIYTMFNIKRPADFKGHSLSVSDVVEVYESDTVKNGFYFCDSFGFKEIPFDSKECKESEKMNDIEKQKISVLLVEPNKYPKMIEIEDSLEAMQTLVGGYIEEYMPYEDEVAIVCNEEGKMSGEALNRAIYSELQGYKKDSGQREIVDIIAGKFFVCYAPVDSEKFLSLPKDLAQKYERKFKYPEKFCNINGQIEAIPFKPVSKDKER